MRHTAQILTLLAALLCLAGCDPERPGKERDIVYTVDAKNNRATTRTEAEWQALLDRFCDYAEEGSTVTFYNAKRVPAKGAKDATSFSTTSREEIKVWMAQMEDAGMTVTISYDPATGTWTGTAYATAPQPPVPVGGLITYECNDMNDFGYIMSFDTANRRAYVTVHDTRQYITDPRHLGGVYEYRHADEVNTPFAYWFINSWGDTAGLYYLEFTGSYGIAGGDTLRYNAIPAYSQATLVRTDNWQTYLYTNHGVNVVLHITGSLVEIYPTQYIGQMGCNDMGRVDFVWPFGGPGRFEMDRRMWEDHSNRYTFSLSLDYRPFGQNEVVDGFTMQGEPMEDDHFTITSPGAGSFLFQRL